MPPGQHTTLPPNSPGGKTYASSGQGANSKNSADLGFFLGPDGLGPSLSVPKPVRIGDKLVELGLISAEQLRIATQEQKNSKKMIGTVLVEIGFITESALGEVLAESSAAQKFDPRTIMLDPTVVRCIPKEIAERHKVIPVSYSNSVLQLAMADVYNVLAIDQVRRHMPKNTKILPIYCTEAVILELIDQYYDYEISIDGVLREIEAEIRDNNKLDGHLEGYINPAVRLVNALLVDAIKQGALDIHFEPEGSFLRLRYRIDGQMMQIKSFHHDYWEAMSIRLKIMAGMNLAETRTPQHGRISYNILGRDVDFRVATQPTVHGENIVLHLLDKAKSLIPLDDLGFSDHNLGLLKKLIKRPDGILIVTGPAGSGKTTTLYSLLAHINDIDTNIMTLEDPVEYQLPLIRQTNVREGAGINWVSGIESVMNQDPDVIFIGEIHEKEAAILAVRAALTGHQVFTALHTNDALGAIPRLNDIGVPTHLLATSLVGCVAQRLARKLCPYCKKPHEATIEECKILGADIKKPPTIFTAGACDKCGHKGYKGRIAIMEVLRIDHAMEEMISTHASRQTMMEHALRNGFVPMQDDGMRKVLNGEISLSELINTIDMTDRL
jgi:general secretion pathway protein E/type IV pilus assembly protein PilB